MHADLRGMTKWKTPVREKKLVILFERGPFFGKLLLGVLGHDAGQMGRYFKAKVTP